MLNEPLRLESGFSFNAFYVITSLPKNEDEKTKALYSKIEEHCKKMNIECAYQEVIDKEHLILVLEHILKRTSHTIPILHLAIHGDKNGLKLLNDSISWNELAPYLSEINKRTKNNLMITLAVCCGAFIIELFEINTERAPFHIVFGPTAIINANLIDDIFTLFYETLFDSKDIKKAYDSIFEHYHIDLPIKLIPSNEFLLNSIILHISSAKKGERRHKIISAYKEKNNLEMPYELKQKIQYPDEFFDFMKSVYSEFIRKYLMSDLYPENELRFQIDKIIEKLYDK
jgi:hypothetical protein